MLFITKLTFSSIELFATNFNLASLSGLFKLIVGGITLSFIANTLKIDSIAPAAPNKWPVIDFVDDT